MIFAARRGHLPIMKWAHENGGAFSQNGGAFSQSVLERAATEAAYAGHLHLLEWILAEDLSLASL
jgi:hypothetical protein